MLMFVCVCVLRPAGAEADCCGFGAVHLDLWQPWVGGKELTLERIEKAQHPTAHKATAISQSVTRHAAGTRVIFLLPNRYPSNKVVDLIYF